MIADAQYEDVLKRCEIGPKDRGVVIRRIPKLLEVMTGVKWRILGASVWSQMPVIGIERPEHLKIYITRPPWRFRTFHAVAVEGPWIHDCAIGEARTVEEYPLRQWRVAKIIEPVSSEAFTKLRFDGKGERPKAVELN